MLTGKTVTDADIRACWDRSACGDPNAGCPGSDPNGWDADKGWSLVNPDDARLALSSPPIFGVGDLQAYWRDRDVARQQCAAAINAATHTAVTVETIRIRHLIALFAAHCECRPLDVDRTEDEHSHDCDTGILDDVQTAIHAIDSDEQDGARLKCAEHWNRDLTNTIYGPLLAAAWTAPMDNDIARSTTL